MGIFQAIIHSFISRAKQNQKKKEKTKKKEVEAEKRKTNLNKTKLQAVCAQIGHAMRCDAGQCEKALVW